ncbi:MAG: alcohol dehydrogenase catalytic domain-containing protein, partial [Rhodobacteraceae bacterium]|nr:alcohol dehydrogenase catalytic domain-containing protein [Paracoccaceae bacterium]
MRGMLLTGHGGMDKLEWREDIPVPTLSEGEVLIKVGACGLNNTDVNTRAGWYSKTASSKNDYNTQEEIQPDDGGWGGTSLQFPRIQGADIAGEVVEVKGSQFQHLLGETVMVDPWIRPLKHPERYKVIGYLGSEIDGGFAEYTKVPGNAVHPVKSEYSLIELATFATSSVTAENMLDRARVK